MWFFNKEEVMKSRHKSMGGRADEVTALEDLEDFRQRLIDRCVYNNEKNWVASVACMNRVSLSKVLFYNEIVPKISDIPGVIFELGVQWGATTNLLYNLTAIHEPFNFRRKIVGFDTFDGFPETSLSAAEKNEGWSARDLVASDDAMKIADECLSRHQVFSAMSHIKRHEFVVGDVMDTVPHWLENNVHETVAMCIFDVDLGIPTRECLKNILPRCQKGTILVFDEYNHPLFPEEGVAAREFLDIMNTKAIKSPYLPYTSYFIL